MVIDPIGIIDEIKCLEDNKINFEHRILIDYSSHIVTPIHKLIDKTTEKKSKNKRRIRITNINPITPFQTTMLKLFLTVVDSSLANKISTFSGKVLLI